MSPGAVLRSRIAHVEIGIADLERQLTELCAHKTQLEAELQAIVYPILTIPAEITAEILCHAASSSQTKWLIAATSVCALWRSIALSTPRLWTSFSDTVQQPIGNPYNLLQLFLARSGTLPLNLTVHLDRDGELMPALMARHIARWRCVDVRQSAFWNDSLSLGEGHPQPEPSLVLHGDVPLNVDSDSCPKWRSVALCCTTLIPSPLLPTLSNVTSLILHCVTSHVVSSVLPHTPSVKFLFLSGYGSSVATISPISLPCVETLHCTFPILLSHVTLPALQTIRVRDSNLPSFQESRQFLTRSACTLRTVHVESCNDPELVNFLRAVPSVLEFTIQDLQHDQVDEHIVIAFLDAFATGAILPAAEKVTLLRILRSIQPKVDAALHKKIQLPSSRLKKLTVEGINSYAMPESLRIALVEKGVDSDVRVTSWPDMPSLRSGTEQW
ncbi:hypothetical protein C8F01DRAFT_1376671 [Mycena amicta]|nr:hypothetical protein C8F01DRAFT_1376671 [Mycena amicta]